MANNKVTYGGQLNAPSLVGSAAAQAAQAASSGGGGSGSGSGGGGSSSPAQSNDYMSVFRELAGKEGGFDPARLASIESVAGQLANTRGNFGATDKSIAGLQGTRENLSDVTDTQAKLKNTAGNFGATDRSIGGLQDFAKTGGLSPEQLSGINRDTLKEFEQTGGYNEGDIANVRSRANSTVPSFYQNLQDEMDRKQTASGNLGPGWDRAGFKMARQGAQQAGDTARDTEIGISNAVREGRMGASTELARNALSTAGLQSGNVLSGYGQSGQLDLAKQGQLSSDLRSSGELGLGVQRQVSDDLTSSGNLDISKQGQIGRDLGMSGDLNLGTQGTINQARLGGAGGMQQDELTRLGISSASGSAAAGRAQQQSQWEHEQDTGQSQWEQEMGQRDRYTGNAGLLSTYGTSPSELMDNQNLLRGYRGDVVNSRIGASNIPGLGSSISSGLGIAGQVAGMGSGVMGAFGGNQQRRLPAGSINV